MKELICKECGGERKIGRRLCIKCDIKRVRKYPRYTWMKVCEACKREFQAWRKVQKLCTDCHTNMQQIRSTNKNNNGYAFTNVPGRTEHRDIVESIISRKLHTNEVIHHRNDNPKDNSLCNLIVISRIMHGRLHRFLDLQRVILEKSGIENFENCWKTLIVPITTTWLETASVKVIKIWEIGQSAAEPLLNVEGSETMHETPNHLVEGDDIVQTTTMKIG